MTELSFAVVSPRKHQALGIHNTYVVLTNTHLNEKRRRMYTVNNILFDQQQILEFTSQSYTKFNLEFLRMFK